MKKELVHDIIRALNVKGRQGPQDLLSDECYSWVSSEIAISREEYSQMILQNLVEEKDRLSDRSAFFVRAGNGRISLFKSTEEELRPYVCHAVETLSDPKTSSRVLKAAKASYPFFTPVDLMIQNQLPGKALQARIDQTIRNILVSNYDRPKNSELFDRSASTPYTYSLTPQGKALAKTVAQPPQELDPIDDEPQPDKSAFSSLPDEKYLAKAKTRPVSYGFYKGGVSSRPATDSRLVAAVLSKSGFRCAIDGGHITFASQSGMPNYVEGHHLIPLKNQPLFPDINLDCPENIIPLCPNCHRALHHGSPEVREKYLKALKPRLEALVAIGIDKETLDLVLKKSYGCSIFS